jgi:putative Ca2+/H+ antiporter (TMEM165/GDT1 family)
MFFTVFLTELGDKTRLAMPLFASKHKTSALVVFASGGAGLLVGAALATFLGTVTSAVFRACRSSSPLGLDSC